MLPTISGLLLVFALLFRVSEGRGHQGISPEDAEYTISPVSLFDLPPFFVGSVHREWVLGNERDVLDVARRSLESKRGDCLVVDVGMNDGFFTQVAGAFGCHTFSFELQPACIDLALTAVRANNFTHLVNIIRAPVSNEHNQQFLLGIGDEQQRNRCDGGFSISGEKPEKKSHKNFQVIGHHKLRTVALDSFLPSKTVIDYLKVDCEGLDLKVLSGAEALFREKRILRASIEITGSLWPEWEVAEAKGQQYFDKNFTEIEFNNVTSIYRRIFSYGYHAKCVNQRGNVENAWDRWKYLILSGKCTDWEFWV